MHTHVCYHWFCVKLGGCMGFYYWVGLNLHQHNIAELFSTFTNQFFFLSSSGWLMSHGIKWASFKIVKPGSSKLCCLLITHRFIFVLHFHIMLTASPSLVSLSLTHTWFLQFFLFTCRCTFIYKNTA